MLKIALLLFMLVIIATAQDDAASDDNGMNPGNDFRQWLRR